jgi:hypothetical protein
MADMLDTSTFSLPAVRDRLAETPAILTALCGGWPEPLWRANEGPGTWSPHEVLCHLVHGEDDDWMPRVRRILSDRAQEPFAAFDRRKGQEKYGPLAPAALLDLFARKRDASLRDLDRCHITDDMLPRLGVHPEFGPVTLQQLLATWVTHDFAHVVQIGRIAAKFHGQWAGPWRAYMSVFRSDR